jgi:hypothetical protein
MTHFDDNAPASVARRAWLRKTAWSAGAAALGLSGPLARADGTLARSARPLCRLRSSRDSSGNAALTSS